MALIVEKLDFLTGSMATWPFFQLWRAVAGVNALFATPLPPEPAPTADVELHNQWQVLASQTLLDSRFVRETELCMPDGRPISLRVYMQLLQERMHSASYESIFGDLDSLLDGVEAASDDSGSAEPPMSRDEERAWLTVEARGCLALCFARDIRFQTLVMGSPARYAAHLVPPDERRAQRFHKRCEDFARDFADGLLLVHDIGERARNAWLYGE
jgi:hypothetical protein